jgi:membrane protease YdiL (CAAX protease family)
MLAVYVPAVAATAEFRPPLPVAMSLIMGIRLGAARIVRVWLTRRGTGLAPFGFAAPVQKEIIFRGLIQSLLQKRPPGAVAIRSAQLSNAVHCTAVLFAIVHMGSGFATMVGALGRSSLAGDAGALAVQYRRHAEEPRMNAPGHASNRPMLWRCHYHAATKTPLRMLWQNPGRRFSGRADLFI